MSYVHELVNEWARCNGKYAATVYNYTDHLMKLEVFLLLGHHFSEIKIDKLQNYPMDERGDYFYELCNIQKLSEGGSRVDE